MAIVFPASPSVNETFTAGSITYKWDGDKWIGLGVTPSDKLIEGSNSLEIDANNNLIWSGNNVGVNTSSPGVRFQVDYDEGAGERGLRLRAYNATNSKSWNISEITGNAGVLSFTNSTNGGDILNIDGINSCVGINTTTPKTGSGLDINNYQYSLAYGAQSGGGRANNANKEGRLVQVHYTNAEEPLGSIVSFSISTANIVNVGGGSSLVNAATETNLYAAPNTTTTGGTKVLSATVDNVTIESNLTVGQAATGVSGEGTSTVSNVVKVGSRNRVNLYQTTTNAAPTTWYLHIARSTSSRCAGTVEILQFGELGGQQTGNGVNYYKALWMSFTYNGPGSLSQVIENNIEAGGNTGTGVTGVTVSQSDDEIIYAINANWYGHIDVIIEWSNEDNLQYQLDKTSTAVF